MQHKVAPEREDARFGSSRSRPDADAGAGAAAWLASLDDAFEALNLSDGAVLSFHHHLRNGDAVANEVLDVAARRGLRNLGVAASSLFPVHERVAAHIRSGVVTRLWTSYLRGPVAEAVSHGALETVAILQSHGSRARAIAEGDIAIDAAFIAAPIADRDGNLTGGLGHAACGPLGYPQSDAAHAAHVVAVVQDVSDKPLPMHEIAARNVEFAVKVDSIGDPGGIESGTTRPATDATSLAIAEQAATVMEAAGFLRDGVSLQTGAGGSSLAAVSTVGQRMAARSVKGSFLSGGICGPHVDLVRAGLFDEIFDVQCFDRTAVTSFRDDPWHHGMSAAQYASPLHPDPIADRLDVMILGAAEIDRDFNINVTTAGNGLIIGGPGGHPDTAAGAKLVIATTRLTANGYAKIVNRVGTVTTPGRDVDVLVTEMGIAVNPARTTLERTLRQKGLPILPVDTLIRYAAGEAERTRIDPAGRVVARLEDREGGLRDEIRALEPSA